MKLRRGEGAVVLSDGTGQCLSVIPYSLLRTAYDTENNATEHQRSSANKELGRPLESHPYTDLKTQ